jgi:non-ribosomal peptide synthetase component F
VRLLVKVLKSGISVFLEYRNSYIPTEQAKNVASTVERILSNICVSPELAICDASSLSDRNRLQIEKWNSAPLENVERTIHDLIYEAVQRRPSDEAVCAWDGSFTYEELDGHACRLASHLVGLGVGPEVIVPLCFDKSKWNVVAMLATMSAGGACEWILLLLGLFPAMRIPIPTPVTGTECRRSHAAFFSLHSRLSVLSGTNKAYTQQFYHSIPHTLRNVFNILLTPPTPKCCSALEPTWTHYLASRQMLSPSTLSTL